MKIQVYLKRPHLDPDDLAGKLVLLSGHMCALESVEAELWINNGWAEPLDSAAYAEHLEAKVADPTAYAAELAHQEVEAKADAAAAYHQRIEVRPSLAELAARKAELRKHYADQKAEKTKAAAAAENLGTAARIIGNQPPPAPDEEE